MPQQHRIVPGRIGIESFKWQLLMAEVFQSPVCQFIAAAFVIATHNAICLQIMRCSRIFEKCINVLALADIGDNERVRTASGQIQLISAIDQTAINRPSVTVPIAAFAAKFNILPIILLPGTIAGPRLAGGVLGKGYDILIQFAAADITNLQLFTCVEDFLIEKAAVHADNNRNIRAILFSDFGDNMLDHFLNRIAMVGVFITTAKDRIDDQSPPVHLQGLKSLFFLVGRFDAMTAFGIIIVHYHGINAQVDYFGLLDPQAPDKKALQQAAKKKSSYSGKRVEKTFDPMRGGHVFYVGFNAAGISSVHGQLIKITQVPTGAVSHKTQHLLEKFKNINPFFIFAKRTEQLVNQRKKLNLVQIGHKQGQSGSAGQTITGLLNGCNFQFIVSKIFAMLFHKVLYLLGWAIFAITNQFFCKYYSILSESRGLFFIENRSI